MRTVRGQRDFDSAYFGSAPNFEPKSLELTHIVNAWWVNAAIREVANGPAIASIASRLLDAAAVRLLHDQVIYKPGLGSDGRLDPAGNVGWHQDAAHWTRGRLDLPKSTIFTSAWIALQDTDLANGCMRFIVGSHKWGLIEDAHSFVNKDLDGLAEKYSHGSNREWHEKPCVLKAGQVNFHSGLMFHGSGPNRTDTPRLSIILNMMPGAIEYSARERAFLAGQPWHRLQRPDRCEELFCPKIYPPD